MTAAPNVLITGAAANIPLVRAFREAAAGLGGRVFVSGADPVAHEAGGFIQLKRPDEPGAFEQTMFECGKRGISLIVPAQDGDIAFFAQHRPAFEARGVRVLAPSPETVAACRDKYAFIQLLAKYGYPSIPILDRHAPDLPFPLFARSPAGGHRIDTAEDLAALGEGVLLRPYIDAPEISIDLLMDLGGGRPVQAVARERVLVVGGESKVTRVIDAPDALALAMRLGATLGLAGHNVMRAFLHPEQGPLLFDIDLRFGGGSVLAIAAGLDSPRRILQMLVGDDTAYAPRAVQAGAALFRADRDVIMPGAAP